MRGEYIPKTPFRTSVVSYICILVAKFLDSFVNVFIDGILVYCKSVDHHVGHLRVVLHVLKQQKHFAEYSTCKFLLRSVLFLGHIISSEGIEINPKKTQAVEYIFRPLTSKDIRSFLGLAVIIGGLLMGWHPLF